MSNRKKRAQARAGEIRKIGDMKIQAGIDTLAISSLICFREYIQADTDACKAQLAKFFDSAQNKGNAKSFAVNSLSDFTDDEINKVSDTFHNRICDKTYQNEIIRILFAICTKSKEFLKVAKATDKNLQAVIDSLMWFIITNFCIHRKEKSKKYPTFEDQLVHFFGSDELVQAFLNKYCADYDDGKKVSESVVARLSDKIYLKEIHRQLIDDIVVPVPIIILDINKSSELLCGTSKEHMH